MRNVRLFAFGYLRCAPVRCARLRAPYVKALPVERCVEVRGLFLKMLHASPARPPKALKRLPAAWVRAALTAARWEYRFSFVCAASAEAFCAAARPEIL